MASAKIIELTDENTCKLCENSLGKYCCPRCNVLYCSLECYQSENHLQCSESFYQQCVADTLSEEDQSESSTLKMLEILKRSHEENVLLENISEYGEALDSDDDEDYMDLGSRLAGIDLNDANDVWEKLTSDERQEFEAFLRTGDIDKIIPKWEPWWTYRSDVKVEELDEANAFEQNCPKIAENIKDFSKLTGKQPADCVVYNLINIVTAYVFTARYFNGDHFDFPKESVSCIISLSLYLKTNQNFEDFDTSVTSVTQEIVNSDWILVDEENLTLIKQDVDRILKGPNKTNKKYYILCALSDTLNLVNKALLKDDKQENDSFSKKFPGSQFTAVELMSKKKLKNCIKTIEYYLSYVTHCFQFQ